MAATSTAAPAHGTIVSSARENVRRLERVIERFGRGSVEHFAAHVVMRNPRTVRRWLSGESPIPKEVRDKLKEWEP